MVTLLAPVQKRASPVNLELALPLSHVRQLNSAKISRVRFHVPEPMRVIPNLFGDDVDNAALALQLALHDHEVSIENGAPLACLNARPYNEIANAGFVFEAHEHDSSRGLGALPVGDDASNPDLSSACQLL